MRETVTWILFCLLLAAAAFGGGYIVRDLQADKIILDEVRNLRSRVLSLEWDRK